MVDLTSFIMGIGLVLGVLGVGVIVVMYIQIDRLKKKCSQLEQTQGHIFNDMGRTDESLNRRINDSLEEVYRIMDSRLDKLTTKLSNPVKKELLQD